MADEKLDPFRCVYCGCKVEAGDFICGGCFDKLVALRKLRALVLEIRRQAKEERRDNGGSKGTAAGVLQDTE